LFTNISENIKRKSTVNDVLKVYQTEFNTGSLTDTQRSFLLELLGKIESLFKNEDFVISEKTPQEVQETIKTKNEKIRLKLQKFKMKHKEVQDEQTIRLLKEQNMYFPANAADAEFKSQSYSSLNKVDKKHCPTKKKQARAE
jgi:hypothetical protein